MASACAACTARAPVAAPSGGGLAAAESVYADLRDLRDRLDVATDFGRASLTAGSPAAAQVAAHNALRAEVGRRLAGIDSVSLRPADAHALGTMRRTLERDLNPFLPSTGPAKDQVCTIGRAADGLDSLRKRLYDCYGWNQSHVTVDRDTLDRLSILGALGKVDDESRRRRLFLALEPVWRSVNGNDEPGSPYRRLIALEARGRDEGLAAQIRASGVPRDSLEPWLMAVLTTWRTSNPDSQIEPWNWYYATGRSSRALGRRISRERLTALNRMVYRGLGADLSRLDVRYDLEPREGKTPVAYTTFGARPRFINGSWRAGRPLVLATYRTGGLDNLNELLHETGHAVHIAAIRTRPAFADWPDSDPFTEAVADLIALDVYEPAWQQRWLGDSVPLADGLRGRYGGIVMDVAWAVFELRMLRDPGADPNTVWTGLTRDYLGIRPHPELSWWAMRAQLIDAPGYMMNYAVGAMLSAAIRARTRELHGATTAGDSTWYGWIAPRLYRFGLERPTREVVEEFLGGPVSPVALLADMRRMASR
ncbi:MAG: hypothetical protein ACJ8BF_14425 [Gemmatimonadales bacterium]